MSANTNTTNQDDPPEEEAPAAEERNNHNNNFNMQQEAVTRVEIVHTKTFDGASSTRRPSNTSTEQTLDLEEHMRREEIENGTI